MLELGSLKKNKINLADYNFQQDIESRIVLSDFSVFDHEVLEEILFSPLKIAIKKLSRSIGCSETDLEPILQKLSEVGLIQLQEDAILVDKERRKYFELQICRFSEQFRPDMEFLQGLLKLIPIHILPSWYAIPRSSNNIFESMAEKYLATPQIYQRYLAELNFSDPILHSILEDVLSSPDLKVSSSDLIAKYNLARRDFEQFMLQLEFHFACFVTYSKEEDHWIESVTPLHEWREYQMFLRQTTAPIIQNSSLIARWRSNDFAFIEDMSAILVLAKKKPLLLDHWDGVSPIPLSLSTNLSSVCNLFPQTPQEDLFIQKYLTKVLEKLLMVKLADRVQGKLYALETSNDWLDLNLENRALYLHRHPLNRLTSDSPPSALALEKHVREAEKSVKRVLHGGWVLFDDFIRGVLVPLNETSVVSLKRGGKHWKFALPQYSEEEKILIKTTLFDWLFEFGMIAKGTFNGQDCFAVTPLGRIFFEG